MVKARASGNTQVNRVHSRRGVDSVEVAGQLLHAMVRLGGVARLKDLAEHTAIPAAKVHRYAVSLVEIGLLRQVPETHQYALGLLATQLGELAPQGMDPVDTVAPAVAQFSREEGRACGVAVWGPAGVTIVRWFGVHSEVTITLRPGTIVNMTTSCTGCVVAAHLPRTVTEPRVREDLKEAGLTGKAAVEAVYQHYDGIRRERIAASHGTRIAGINALSVPVLNHSGELIVAVSMLGHESEFAAGTDSADAARLRQLADRLSGMVGAVSGRSRWR